ncbi:MAG: hypothetical protein ABW275_07475 [Hansschlegelia sp.]
MRVALGLMLAAMTAAPSLAEMAEPPPVSIPELSAAASGVEGFAPNGWAVEAKAEGDLNADGKSDVAFVLHQTDPKNVLKNKGLGSDEVDTNPRILGVALAAAGGYRLAAQNATLIPRHVQSTVDDPFWEEAGDLAIAKGSVKVGLHFFANAGGWQTSNTTFTFRLVGGGLELIGFDRSETMRNSGEMTSISVNYPAGRMSVGKGSIEDDKETTTWRKAPKRGPRIEAIGDGLDFDPSPK